MPNLARVVFDWTGTTVVGGGKTVVHCATGDETTLVAAMNVFWTAINTLIPTGTVINSPTSGDTIDEASGHVVSHWAIPPSGPVLPGGTANFVNGVGARLKFPTIGVVGGRAVVGAIFVVPLVATAYEGAGNLLAANVTLLTNQANTLATTPNALRIYSRPAPGRAGTSYPALSGFCPDRVSWLRSRRT